MNIHEAITVDEGGAPGEMPGGALSEVPGGAIYEVPPEFIYCTRNRKYDRLF